MDAGCVSWRVPSVPGIADTWRELAQLVSWGELARTGR